MKQLLLAALTRLKMQWIKFNLWKPFIQLTKNPEKIQTELLLRIIKNNAGTRFGVEHQFHGISHYEDYQKHVPVMAYEALQPYIESQELEKQPDLCENQPVMYAQTSGSSSSAKLIPINKQIIKQYRLSQNLVAYATYSLNPDAFKGKILAIVSPAIEGYLDTGTPYGAMSGLIYNSMPTLTRSKYVLPAKVFDIKDYEQKYYKIALYALKESNITMIATANPSTLVKLDQVINDHCEMLIRDIDKLKPKRAYELRLLLNKNGKLSFSQLWCNLRTITTWTAGSCSAQLPNIKSQIKASTKIVELGYLASEFRGGITIDAKRNTQIPAIHENFYEFVEKSDWEQGLHRFKTLAQVTTGKQYYIFVTTQAGLYRYDISDIVEVTGWYNKTPIIRFVQKGKGIINLTGEKLYESQVIQAVTKALPQNTQIPFFIMLGCPKTLTYTLYIESIEIDSKIIEQAISQQNIEFKEKLSSSRLRPIKVVYIKQNTSNIYKKDCFKHGQREGQFKLNYLQYKDKCSFNFDQYSESECYAT